MASAHGIPPDWITTIHGAEVWALYAAARCAITGAHYKSDCLSVVRSYKRGRQWATAAERPMARAWNLIFELLGDGTTLVWMPAHTSIDQCVHRMRSDLKQVSATDWRANQLADVLAKSAAVDDPGRRAAAMYIGTSKRALLHHAVILGMATHGANNHLASRADEHGNVRSVTLRDSTSLPPNARRTRRAPAGIKRKRKEAACVDELNDPAVVASIPKHMLGITRTAERASAKRARAAAAKEQERCILTRVVADAAQRLQRPAHAASASERLAALRERVRLRALT